MGNLVVDVALAVTCLAIGLLHLQLASGQLAESAAHAVMGLGMAAMFVPAADPIPRPVWLAVFVALGAWAAVAAVRERSLVGPAGHHLVGAAAMVFMVLSHVHPVHHEGVAPSSGGLALLLAVLALAFTAWFVADIARILAAPATPRGAAPAAGAGGRLALRLARPARVAASAAMVVMLVAIAH